MSITSDLASLVTELKHEWNKAVEEQLLLAKQLDVSCDLTVYPTATGIYGHVNLPRLPDSEVWEIGAAAENMIKATVAGSAGNTVVAVKNGSTTLVTMTLANTDTDDVLVAGGTATTPTTPVTVPGGTVLDLNATTLATAASGHLVVNLRFRRRTQMNSLFVAGA